VHRSHRDRRQHITVVYFRGDDRIDGPHHIVVGTRQYLAVEEFLNSRQTEQAAEQNVNTLAAQLQEAQAQLQARQAQTDRASSEADSAMSSIDNETTSEEEQERRAARAARFGTGGPSQSEPRERYQ
jgi:hypothetical protein